MPEELSLYIMQSDEVLSYPTVLRMLKVDWWDLAVNGETDKQLGFTMAAVYTDEIREDAVTVRGICRTSHMPYAGCARLQGTAIRRNFWPSHRV